MEAAMNRAEASSSFSPFTLLNRPLESIHISRGMLKIRMSVMELGRFTLQGAPVASRNPVLIMLHGQRERNASKVPGINHRGQGAHRGFFYEPVLSVVSLLLRGGHHRSRFGLLGDDHVFDLVVSCLGDDFLLHKFVLGPVGAAVDDFLRVSVADSWKLLELIFTGRVDVELVGG